MTPPADGLTKAYGSVTAVDGLDLTIGLGEVVALLGPNGAGKSTTIDMLLGLARPDTGTARLFGLPPAQAIADGRDSPLTAREADVLRAARGGGTIAHLAATLALSEGTVRNHLSSAIGRTGARTRAAVVRLADESGWL